MKRRLKTEVTITRNYIEGEISNMNRYGNAARYVPKPETDEVKRARVIIARWDRAQALRKKAFDLDTTAAMAAIRRAFYTFQPTEKVLKMLDHFKAKFVTGRPEEE